jgi:hypothetical protein
LFDWQKLVGLLDLSDVTADSMVAKRHQVLAKSRRKPGRISISLSGHHNALVTDGWT